MSKIGQMLTSMEVAEMVEKKHSDLLKDIRRYVKQLAEGKIPSGDFFTENVYMDANNQSRPCYLVTKKGCEFIAHKLTGQKGTEFTARYINRFHEMEQSLSVPQLPQNPMELLELHYKTIRQVDNKVNTLSDDLSTVRQDLEAFKNDMPILGVEESLITSAVKKRGVECLGGKQSNAYKDRSLRGQLYSDLHRQLRQKFGVSTYKAIKRNQTDTAIAIIGDYAPPLVLIESIDQANAQMTLDLECRG